jgi:hypothetical protein
MAGRDHAGAGKFGAERQRVGGKTHQIVDKQEQPSYARGELTRGKYEVADIGDGLSIGADPLGTFLVEPTRQGREAFVGQNLAHRGDAQWRSLLLERLTDLVDRIVALAQRHDLLHGTALLGLSTRTGSPRCEELRQLPMAKAVAQHSEGSRRIAEAPRRLG